MLRTEFPDAGEQSPEALLDAYEAVLVATIESVGADVLVESTELEEETVSAAASGDVGEHSLDAAAAILGSDPERPDADTIQMEAQDILLMGMTTAVMDVEALASGIDSQLEPKEIQQKIEGRYPMTLAEYALLHSYIESQKQ